MPAHPTLPLDVLPTFVAVADAGSMRAAGEALHLTHSAISQQIRQLEDRLGFAVFARQGRGLVLTPAGQRLLDGARGALAQLADARQNAERLAQGDDTAVLRLAVLPSFAQRWLTPRMARWRAVHPGLRLEMVAAMQTADLRQEGLHVAIRHGSGQWRGLRSERLIQSPRRGSIQSCCSTRRSPNLASHRLCQWPGPEFCQPGSKRIRGEVIYYYFDSCLRTYHLRQRPICYMVLIRSTISCANAT